VRQASSSGDDAVIQRSLDELLVALDLETVSVDRFRAPSELPRFPQLFGGQMLAQALVAAARSVEEKAPHSLHAYFVEAGRAAAPVEIAVERVRDGRSFATRRASVSQGDRLLLVLLASFQLPKDGARRTPRPPEMPAPETLPSLQDWAARMPEALRERGRLWIDRPPPIDFRIAEPPVFLAGRPASAPRAHWLRVPRDLGDDPLLHSALLAYASDYLLMDVIFRAHSAELLRGGLRGFSLDHALWMHRAARVDDWLLYVQSCDVLGGERGLAEGQFFDGNGQRVATVMQEAVVQTGSHGR